MKLLRHGPKGSEKPGLLDGDGRIRDLSGEIADITGDIISPDGLAQIAALDPKSLPVVEGSPRLGPCIGHPQKFLAIGLNYRDHAEEAGMDLPPEPLLFTKHVNCISGPNDDIEIPRGSSKTDWEAELGIVIGTRAKYIEEADAPAHIAGYCVINDVSEREFQIERAGQFVKGKSHDTFGPVGPWLVTRDEVPDPQDLSIWLDVNGERKQTGTTATMVFDCAHIVAYLSAFLTLEAGDVIATGTPPGVGMGAKPPRYLKAGDTVRLGIDGLGEQQQLCVDA